MLSACETAPAEDEHAEERVAPAAQALEEDTICHEGAGLPPLTMRWSFDTQSVLETDAETLVQLELEAREDVKVALRLVSEGLDARTVSRDYGSYDLGAGDPVTVDVRLADLPLQAVTHSATGTVEATMQRADGTAVTMHSPPFQHHFTAGYESIVTYPYDEMIDQFQGGQLGENAFDVTGRVFIDGEWRAIDDQRLIELEAPSPFAPPIDVLLPDHQLPALPPEPPTGPLLCVDWGTRYTDAAHGEDVANTPGDQSVDASHALVSIEKVSTLDCSGSSPGTCGEVVWEGMLDSLGCTRVPGAEEGDDYFVWVYPQFAVGAGTTTAELRYYNDGGDDLGVPVMRLSATAMPDFLGWGNPNPLLVDHVGATWRTWENAAAVLSLQFASRFVVPGSSTTVNANKGCSSAGGGIPSTDACAGSGRVDTGPWTRPSDGEPGTLQYKYVLAHEVGHTAMAAGSGNPDNDYGYFYSLTEDACICDHIPDGTVNELHCLQSVEYSSTAQVEGFGHFVAAGLFNDPAGADCRFNYYKHFRRDDGTVKRPPYDVDCRNAVLWRDSHDGCMFAEAGTEYDWMQFYWNVNTVGSDTTTVDNLFAIYQLACGGPCDDGSSRVRVTWGMLRDAAQAYFGEFDPRFIKFETSGNEFGVDEDF